MKKTLRILAVFILLLAAGFWAAKGANRGWTKTNLPREVPDPVTGLTGVQYEKGFVPGVDFLAAAAAAAGVTAGASHFVKNKNTVS